MPSYRDLERATGASRTLIRAVVEELDPDCRQRHKEGKSWILTDQLASAVAHETAKRVRRPADGEKSQEQTSNALEIIEKAHRREIESLRAAHDAEMKAAETVQESLRESLSERDRTIEGLRAELAIAKADAAESQETLAAITGAKWYTRAFNLRRLLPSPTAKKRTGGR